VLLPSRKLSVEIRELGEKGLLARIQRFCPPDTIGDDAAVLVMPPDRLLVVTTDLLVDGVHFSDRTTSPEDVGWRAAAANLSDLAAMGAFPIGITVALGLPGNTKVDWVERLYQGMVECLQHYQTTIVGGDICRSSTISVAITAFGQVLSERIIRRRAAKLGDAIVATGVHGASRAGLELLLHPELGQSLTSAQRLSLIAAHQRPRPRLDVLPILWQIVGKSEAIAGMDSSDGLADAIVQLCQTSGVGAEIERHQIPIPTDLNTLVSPEQALEWALYGGEDFELVLCLPLEMASLLVQQLSQATIVGRITANSEVKLIDRTKEYPDQVLTLSQGFQHF